METTLIHNNQPMYAVLAPVVFLSLHPFSSSELIFVFGTNSFTFFSNPNPYDTRK